MNMATAAIDGAFPVTGAIVAADNLTKRFAGRGADGGVLAVHSLSFVCERGELLALLGPSGCGKSTTLRILAGLEKPTSGRVLAAGRDITRVRASQRGIGLAFENYALYPPMTVYENIAFNLRARGLSSGDIDRRVRDIAERMQLNDVLHLRPRALSSGHKQRVNLARAFVRQPRLVLLDEPLSHLDGLERRRLRAEIKELQKDWNVAIILVTHDQEEAASLADRIAVLNSGELQQLDEVQKLFESPANLFTARFIGDPPMNVWPATATTDSQGGSLTVQGSLMAWLPLQVPNGRSVSIGVRPHDIDIVDEASGELVGKVTASEFLGDESHVQVAIGAVSVSVYGPLPDIGPGVSVGLRFRRWHLFDNESGKRLGTFGAADSRWRMAAC
jgi:multiple sugar transport system ATP-binding protein